MSTDQFLTKKNLELLIYNAFLNFGNIKTSRLLDAIKAFGFFYATSSGLSISLDDLKSPEIKQNIFETIQSDISNINKKWVYGFIGDSARFQNILSQWTNTTELLKNEIIKYYKDYDPANSLYIMAFSGARGNIDQVRQIVGIRGLMTDQAGNIVTTPIESNFKEGLTSLDYLISAYGARKGLVDTALKTAVAGYLTRRLIFAAQSIIIRQLDCKTTSSIIIDLTKNSNTSNLVGNFCELALKKNNSVINFVPKLSNSFITEKKAQYLKNKNLFLKIKSPLTCTSEFSLCQKCYGWDLSKKDKISLGEAVGILAGQSIGEPGTQLTMRTFHTGGVFTGSISTKFLVAPLSGKLISYENLEGVFGHTLFGDNIIKLTKTLQINLFNWQSGYTFFNVSKGLEFFLSLNSFYQKGAKMANLKESDFFKNYKTQQLIPIHATNSGQILSKKMCFRKLYEGLYFALQNCRFSVATEDLFTFPAKTEYRNWKQLNIKKSLGFLNILVAPVSGYISIHKECIFLYSQFKKFSFDLQNSIKFLKIFPFNQPNSQITNELLFLVKNYQFVDKETICARVESFPKINEKVFTVKHKNRYKLFKKQVNCIKNSDIFTIFLDQFTTIFSNLQKNNTFKADKKITSTVTLPLPGKLIKKDGLCHVFQRIKSYSIPKGSLFYQKLKQSFLFKNELIFHSIIYKQQANDIVQGLPKINRIVDANNNPLVNNTFYAPNLLLNSQFFFNFYKYGNEKIVKNIRYSHIYATRKKSKNKHQFFFLDTTRNTIKNTTILDNTIFDNKKNKIKFKFFKQKLNITSKFFKGYSNIFSISTAKSKKEKLPFLKFFYSGQTLNYKNLNPHLFLCSNYYYYSTKFKCSVTASILALQKLQLILTNSMQSIYYHQGVNISNKHVELIIRQLTSKVFLDNFNLKLSFQQELIYCSVLKIYNDSLNSLYDTYLQFLFFKDLKNKKKKEIYFKNLNKIFKKYFINQKKNLNLFIFPVYLGSAANSALINTSFLTAASFQDTKFILSKASILGSVDWLFGLKEALITGRLPAAGSSYFYSKNYLDTFYFYKNKILC